MASDVERQSSRIWQHVDAGHDAARLADFLGRVTAIESVQAYKRHAYAALGVTEGARVLDVGCGVGGDVRAIAQRVGRTGRRASPQVGLEMARVVNRRRVRTPSTTRPAAIPWDR
jgi:ubiquinone/menaquinone biosynthesis C-methylase UbiE